MRIIELRGIFLVLTTTFLLLLLPQTTSTGRGLLGEVGDIAINRLPPGPQIFTRFLGGLIRGGREYKVFRRISKKKEAEGRSAYNRLVNQANKNLAADGDETEYRRATSRAEGVRDAYNEEAKQIRRIGRLVRKGKQNEALGKMADAFLQSKRGVEAMKKAAAKIEQAKQAIEVARGDLKNAIKTVTNTGALGKLGKTAGEIGKAAGKIEDANDALTAVGLRPPPGLEKTAKVLRGAEDTLKKPGEFVERAGGKADDLMKEGEDGLSRVQDELNQVRENGVSGERAPSRRTTRQEKIDADPTTQDLKKRTKTAEELAEVSEDLRKQKEKREDPEETERLRKLTPGERDLESWERKKRLDKILEPMRAKKKKQEEEAAAKKAKEEAEKAEEEAARKKAKEEEEAKKKAEEENRAKAEEEENPFADPQTKNWQAAMDENAEKRAAETAQRSYDESGYDPNKGKYTSKGLDKGIKQTIKTVTPTPSPSPEPTPSPTPGVTPTPSPTASPSPKPSPTPPATGKPGGTITVVPGVPVSPGKSKIVQGQLVALLPERYEPKIAGMTVTLTGKASRSTSSNSGGGFSFPEIPAGTYTIAVKGWSRGMTATTFRTPPGKAIRIVMKGSCPYLFVWTGDRFEKENDIYSTARLRPAELMAAMGYRVEAGEGLFVTQLPLDAIPLQLQKDKSYRDYYRLVRAPKANGKGTFRLKIVERADEYSFTDLGELLAIKRPNGFQVGVTREGKLFYYDDLQPVGSGRDLHGNSYPEKEPIAMYNRDVLELTLPGEAFDKGVLAVTWQGFQTGNSKDDTFSPGRPYLALQRLDPAGKWRTVDSIYPRDEVEQAYLLLEQKDSGWDAGGRVRLVAANCWSEKFHRIDRVAWGRVSEIKPLALELPLESARKSGEPEQGDLLRSADGRSLQLGPSEEVSLKFNGSVLDPEEDYTFFFVSEGFYLPAPQIRVAAKAAGE